MFLENPLIPCVIYWTPYFRITYYYLKACNISLLIKFFVFLGAHSHIRGLGLDDALEARTVRFELK